MEGQYDNTIAPQQNQNIIQVNQPQVYNDQSPGIEMSPIVNNQMDNANQPMINNQVNPIPIHTIPLSDINSWGSIPHKVTCPYCHQNVTTSVYGKLLSMFLAFMYNLGNYSFIYGKRNWMC